MRGLTRSIPRAASAALVALVCILLPQAAGAQGIALTIQPSYLEFSGDPGASTSQVITVINEGEDPLRVSVAISKLPAASEERSAVAWLSVDRQHLQVGPGESQEVTVTIRIPKDAQPGGFYGAVHFQAGVSIVDVAPGAFAGGTGVGTDLISSFMITVRSEDPAALKLEGVVAKVVPIAKGKDTIGFRVEIENTGNVHFAPEGEIELKDPDGNVIGTLTLPEGAPVLPGTTRSYTVKGALDVPPGNYEAEARIDYSWETWQADVAKTDTQEWSHKETTEDITFNSVPRLRIKSITPVVQPDGRIRTEVEIENVGDVEVAPQGYIDVLTTNGDRAFAFNLGGGDSWVEPGTSATAAAEYTGVMPKGDYTVETVFSYHGKEEAQKKEFFTVKEDIVPPPAPNLPPQRKAELAVVKRGIPTYVLIIALVFGAAGAVATTLLAQKYHLVARATAFMKRSRGQPPMEE